MPRVAPATQARLAVRQRRLQFLIKELSEELAEVTRQLSYPDVSRAPRLDRVFFEEVVVPLLAKHGKVGLPSRDIFRLIRETGLSVDYDNLRLFLTRAAKKGTIRQVKMLNGPNRWALVDSPTSSQLQLRTRAVP
jgi:hypothetical protein